MGGLEEIEGGDKWWIWFGGGGLFSGSTEWGEDLGQLEGGNSYQRWRGLVQNYTKMYKIIAKFFRLG